MRVRVACVKVRPCLDSQCLVYNKGVKRQPIRKGGKQDWRTRSGKVTITSLRLLVETAREKKVSNVAWSNNEKWYYRIWYQWGLEGYLARLFNLQAIRRSADS